MAISSDWIIDPVNYRIAHNPAGSTTIYTVNALYSYLESVFAGVGYIQYPPPMSASTPTSYTMINHWFIDEASLQYLSGGGIATSGWDNSLSPGLGIMLLQFGSTYTPAVASDIGKTVVQGANSGTLLAYNNTAGLWWVRAGTGTIGAGATTITGGTGAGTSTAVSTGESLFSNLYTLGSPLQAGTQLYISQGVNTLISSYWSSGHVDLVLPVQRAGALINSGNVTVYAREYGNTDNYFTINLSAGGRNPVPLSTSVDTSIVDSAATVAAFATLPTLAYGTAAHDLNNGGGAKNYDLAINCNGMTVLKVYEWLQYITGRGQTAATYTNGTQGQLFLGLPGYTPVPTAPFGTFAGGKFFAAQGVWLYNMAAADIQNYQLTANDGSTQIPPNIQSITVSNLVAGDQVLVARSTGAGSTTINYSRYTLAAAGNASGSGTVVVNGTISADEPQSGTLRIRNASGGFDRYPYTSWSGSTFTLSGTLSANYNGATMWVPLIDQAAAGSSVSTQLIVSAPIYDVVRVRRYASGAGNSIQPFETSGTVSLTGQSVSAIRTTDAVAT